MKHNLFDLNSHPLAQKFYDLSIELEKLPADPRQTDLVVDLNNLQRKAQQFVDSLAAIEADGKE